MMKSLSILYAEDEEQTRLNYTEYLKIYFKKVYSVSDGAEALKCYEMNKPDILLLDINMPKINGLEVVQKIRQNDKITRIIMLTAHLEKEKLLLAAELNLTKYLPKPITRQKLKSALQEATNQFKELALSSSMLDLGDDYLWNTSNQILTCKEKTIKLTKYEILFLKLLSSQKNHVFSLDEISIYLWNEIFTTVTNTNKLKDIIKRLRKKLPKNSIENIYGSGYKLKVT